MRVLLATIEHSGTRFFANLLALPFGNPRIAGTEWYAHVADGPPFVVTHVQNKTLIERYVAEFAPLLVTTTRNLDMLLASYVRRNVAEDLPRYLSDWLRMVDRFKPLVVSVDAADREQRLAQLSELVGVSLSTSWRPVERWPGEL